MSAAPVKTKNELILEIKKKIKYISGNDAGNPVNFDNSLFYESGRSSTACRMNITCLFINEDGTICADIYRSGSEECVDYICGLDLNSLNEKILIRILSAIDHNKWSVNDSADLEKEKKRIQFLNFKIPFLQKGA